MKRPFEKKRIVVLGLGVSGKSAMECLLKQGAAVVGVDAKADDLLKTDASVQTLHCKGALILKDDAQLDFSSIDLAVVSPGISQSHPIYQAALRAMCEVISEVELASRLFPSNRWIGVTGTNGKTTVTLLIAHILNACGKQAAALGNVGTPLSTYAVRSPDEILVAELSSFQLERMSTPILSHALLLNITPDHLDRYDSMNAYAAAKFRIKDCLKPEGTLFVEENTAFHWESEASSAVLRTYGFQPKSTIHFDGDQLFYNGKPEARLTPPLSLKKNHDTLNVLAAYAVCRQMGVSPSEFIQAVSTFKKPPHRIEYVCSIRGVSYYDDSKGTNIDAVAKAICAMGGPIILIAGGVHKGTSYDPWISLFQNRVKHVCAIGQAASLIYDDLFRQIPVEICETLAQAVNRASQLAHAGDCVLLSPGCSSFDMFRDYAHRGDEFKRCVRNLE